MANHDNQDSLDFNTTTAHLQVSHNEQIAVRRLYQREDGPPAFLLHGLLESGRIFYSRSGKGLGPYLARCGFDVFIPDHRGRGESTPPITRSSRTGQTEAIVEDITAIVQHISEQKGPVRQHWIGHSWGGVLLAANLARFAKHRQIVQSLILLGARRRVTVRNLRRFLMVDVGWCLMAPLLIRCLGYLPAGAFGPGTDAETAKTHRQSCKWLKQKEWIDPDDQFDYAQAAADSAPMPPVFALTGCKDFYLGHPQDVEAFASMLRPNDYRFEIISRASGAKRNYGHINLLTHRDAVADHFPRIASWMKYAGKPEQSDPDHRT